ncbi:HhH-GPD-type base excision DNA repair protein [Actinoallomurus bryophytorum]|uniref:Putative HhH-GPD family protein n=1 Tax=Actinoallomurus bryophytorum TaxID=1490222 RepID=A0A543CRF9_9ACTN|nr:HhH-GPD-type base excision DNA repair protein [Actinoallomurus bryophytorum]TQL99703.1 putative HhH-GPD family protein [Actinoallomurus bryophytorum]
MTVSLPIAPEANALLNRSPLALLMAMLLDQQVPLERAFSAPADLARRLGHDPDVEELAGYDPDALVAVFSQRPALHRFPKAMAARVQTLCRLLLQHYDGDAERVWADAGTGRELLERVGALPGFGEQKAKIFVALLGKRLGVRPEGWREAAGPYGEDAAHRSIADIVDEDSLGKVRSHKQQMKAAAKAKNKA